MKVHLLYGHPRRVSGIPGTRNHTLKPWSYQILLHFLTEVELFNRGRYEESFVKDCRTIQGRSENGKEFFQ